MQFARKHHPVHTTVGYAEDTLVIVGVPCDERVDKRYEAFVKVVIALSFGRAIRESPVSSPCIEYFSPRRLRRFVRHSLKNAAVILP